jgi:hypothetical protein
MLLAKVPTLPNRGGVPKTAFRIDLTSGPGPTCTCPGGHTTAKLAPSNRGRRVFVFPVATCAACPLRAQCLTDPNGRAGAGRRTGRTILLHPQDALLQAARAFQRSPAAAAVRRRRQAAGHRLARLVHLGVRQARYVGRPKTLFQVLLAATVANLTLLANADLAASVGAVGGDPRVHALTVAFTLGTAVVLSLLGRALGFCTRPDLDATATARGRLIAVNVTTSRPDF